MQTANYSTTLKKAISGAVLISLTCVVANTQAATEILKVTTSNVCIEKVSQAKLICKINTSQAFLVEFSNIKEYVLIDGRNLNREVLTAIQDFKELKSCWDGDDAEPIAFEAVDSAHQFLESYSGNLIFDAFPDPDGSVGLQADFEEGRAILISMMLEK